MSVTTALACLVATLTLMERLCCAAYPLGRYGRSLAWAPLPLYYQRATRPLYYPESDYYYPQPQEYYYPLPAYYMDQQRPYYYSYDEVLHPSPSSIVCLVYEQYSENFYNSTIFNYSKIVKPATLL